MGKKIAVIGSSNMDIVTYIDQIPGPGETRLAHDFHLAGGGKGANQAVAAARLGADVLFVAVTGDDLFGEAVRRDYEAAGIDTRYVFVEKGTPTGNAVIPVEDSGQNRILVTKGANALLTPEKIQQAASAIETCSLIVLQLEIPLESIYAVLELGKREGIPVLLNPAPANPDLSLEMACLATYFVPNESELAILTGMPTGTVDEIKAAARSLLARGMKKIIVTMGSRGSLYLTSDHEEIIETTKVRAVDSTGAGDAFIGCFAAELAEGVPTIDALKRASKYAALSVTKKGTQDSYLTREEFLTAR